MPNVQITADEFVAEANRLLRLDSGWVEGLAFLPLPPGSVEIGATGYQYDGDWHPAYQRAWDKTGEKFEIKR